MSDGEDSGRAVLGKRGVTVFMNFALAYFFSALLRAVTATLAPLFSQELNLGAAQLGLLAGAYFLGFAIMQLPVGRWLDGPKRVMIGLLLVAVVGCMAFVGAGAKMPEFGRSENAAGRRAGAR